MKRKYRNLAVSLAALNFLSIGTNAKEVPAPKNDNLKTDINKKETFLDDKSKNNGKNFKTKDNKRSKSFVGNLGPNGKSLAVAASGAIVGRPIVRSVSYLGKKMFFSKSHYYLVNTHIKASNWKKVENIIMSSAYSHMISSKDLWKSALEKLQRQCTGYIVNNTGQLEIKFDNIKDKKISELQYEFSKEINEFRKFILNRFYQKKDPVPPNSNQVYEGISEAKCVREAFTNKKTGLAQDDKTKFDKNEREIIAWLLISFVDDSSVTNLTYDQLRNGEEGKKIIDAIISGEEN